MRKIIAIAGSVIALPVTGWACDACQKQQPAFTRGITHGAGPAGNADWIIVIAMVAVSLVTLFLSARYLVRPGEKHKSHIKHSIFQ